ncbi:MAG: helix-turn-helix domain-containing protein [Cellulomonadaceae bacterium]|nr:helix-turn-helix domain-containing protein [Cellulomonadaceae bacterium]
MSNQEKSHDITRNHDNDAYTIQEVADMARLSLSTIGREIRSGALEAVLVGKRSVRIPRPAYESWLRARPVTPRDGGAS